MSGTARAGYAFWSKVPKINKAEKGLRLPLRAMGLRLLLLFFPAMLLCAVSAKAAGTAAPLVVRHNLYEAADSQVLNYRGEILQLVLEKSRAKYGPYVLENGHKKGWGQTRIFNQLELGNLDVVASMTNDERESKAIPVRYCLYKGLLGVRIGLGNKENVTKFNSIRTREELDQIEMGQVFDWPDYSIQRDAGLKVLSLPDLPSSLNRLKIGSFQLMPMGVVEVNAIAKNNDLFTVSNWALAYPTAYYFFVGKQHPELAQRLAYGFEQAIRDHSFDALFSKRMEPLIQAAGLGNRKLFFLKNPYLPARTPLERKELWHPLVLQKLK